MRKWTSSILKAVDSVLWVLLHCLPEKGQKSIADLGGITRPITHKYIDTTLIKLYRRMHPGRQSVLLVATAVGACD